MSFLDRLRRIFGAGTPGAEGAAHGEQPTGMEVIPCEEALRLVHDFIDGELEGVSRAEVERHFEVCRRCYPHLRLERSFRAALCRACAREKAPPELRERVLHIVSGGGADA